MSPEDDLAAFRKEPVVAALTAPATPEELAGEQAAVDAFASAFPVRRARRMAGRFGTGATIVVAVAVSGGAAAAAYTQSLPTPIQHAAHGLLARVGVPDSTHVHVAALRSRPHHPGSHPGPVAPPSRRPVAPGAAPTAQPSGPSPSSPAHRPAPHRAHVPARNPAPARAPHAAPSPAPTTGQTPPPAAPSAPVPAAVSAQASATRVRADSFVSVSGRVTTSSGAPVASRRVRLMARTGTSPRVLRVTGGVTDAQGDITLTTGALRSDTVLRLVTGQHLRSPASRVVVVPVVTVTSTANGPKAALSVAVAGGRAGDRAVLQRRRQSRWVAVSRVALDGSGSTTYQVTPPRRGAARYRVIVWRTHWHATGVGRAVVHAAPRRHAS